MEDGKSAMYQRAIAAGISDGFARRFASELRAFKGFTGQKKQQSCWQSRQGRQEDSYYKQMYIALYIVIVIVIVILIPVDPPICLPRAPRLPLPPQKEVGSCWGIDPKDRG